LFDSGTMLLDFYRVSTHKAKTCNTGTFHLSIRLSVRLSNIMIMIYIRLCDNS